MSQRSVRVSAAAGCFLLLAVATGCGNESGNGDDDPGTATDSSSASTPSPDSPTSSDDSGSTSDSSTGAGGRLVIGETVEPGQAVIVSVSNVDGDTATRASALVDDAALDDFLAATDTRLAAQVRAAVEAVQVPADSSLFGAVVSVGCDRPTAISWTRTFEGIEVTPTLPKSGVQCLVPITSVALFLVPN